MANLVPYVLATIFLCQSTVVLSRQIDYDNIIFPTEDENGRTQIPSFPQIPSQPQVPSQPPRPPTTSGTTTTTATAEYRNCISSCLVTQQYNPICGTNGQTFDNINKLGCAQQCGLDVEMGHIGVCRPNGK